MHNQSFDAHQKDGCDESSLMMSILHTKMITLSNVAMFKGVQYIELGDGALQCKVYMLNKHQNDTIDQIYYSLSLKSHFLTWTIDVPFENAGDLIADLENALKLIHIAGKQVEKKLLKHKELLNKENSELEIFLLFWINCYNFKKKF